MKNICKIFTTVFFALSINSFSQSLEKFNKEKITDDGITSEIHKNNIGKMVFSKSHIEQGKEVPANFTTSFTGNDLIYARCYLAESFWNTPIYVDAEKSKWYPSRDCKFIVDIMIDGKSPRDIPEIAKSPYNAGVEFIYSSNRDRIATSHFDKLAGSSATDRQMKATTFELYINTSSSEKNNSIGSDWPLIANLLTPGEHTIKFLLKSGVNSAVSFEPFCIGEIKYTKKATDYIPYGKNYAAVAKEHPAGMKNPALEAQIKQLVETSETCGKPKVLKLFIEQDSWTVNKNYNGKPEFKAITAWCVVKENGICKAGIVHIGQDYNGKGYDTAYVREWNTTGEFIDCSTVK